MALINCPNCSNQISDKALRCPHCGHALASHSSASSKEALFKRAKGNITTSVWSVVLLVGIILAGCGCYELGKVVRWCVRDGDVFYLYSSTRDFLVWGGVLLLISSYKCISLTHKWKVVTLVVLLALILTFLCGYYYLF